ncbi:phosphotransferase [Sphingomonas psychrolutea]|uniref:Aminoglycoside phosphotransferase n=1 Tax=Sphingomonas psychrolutea TaxID=1259676 RepID=A0ABQ1G4U1_9SPHN|nr:phosphotransferase [Sphingomonas psychrolutea]GGA36960.1 aminoglycoside phosphotransferase [Sphingomonas psychrolutea]
MPFSFDPAPARLDDVLDPAWLTGVLSTRWPDAVVRDVTVIETLVTQATKVRLALDVAGGGDDVPTQICIKGILTMTQVPSTASVVETRFYRDCAAHQPVRVPHCIYAALNAPGDNGVIVMRDEIAAGGTFLSALVPFTPDEARQTLEQLAQFHAAGWHDRPLFDQPWVPRFLDQIGAAPIMPLDRLQALLDGPKATRLPPAIKDAARLQRGVTALAAQIRERPACLVHGDAHAGNIYRCAEGFGLVDWQILQKGEWAQDIAYHLAAVLSPVDRRAHERALLDHYRDRLAALGGPRLDAEEAWRRYRAAMLYGYFLWAITQRVDPAITEVFTHRLGTAVDDLDSFAAVAD